MPVISILGAAPFPPGSPAEPLFFRDLNLDQVCVGVAVGREHYDLAPFLRVPLHEVAAVEYRHAVFKDLESPVTLTAVAQYAQRMRAVRKAWPRRASSAIATRRNPGSSARLAATAR
jgi:hypothetical protein